MQPEPAGNIPAFCPFSLGIAEGAMSNPKNYIVPKLNRFNWLSMLGVSPFDYGVDLEEEHERSDDLLSKEYENFYSNGNKDAIFQFMKASRRAYRSHWVLDQIEKWHEEASPSSRAKIKKLAATYTDVKGFKKFQEVLGRIKRDIKIFEFILKQDRGIRKLKLDIIQEAGRKFALSSAEVKKIWDYYNGYRKKHREYCLDMRQRYEWPDSEKEAALKLAGNAPENRFLEFYPNYQFSEEGFSSYLRKCFENLKNL